MLVNNPEGVPQTLTEVVEGAERVALMRTPITMQAGAMTPHQIHALPPAGQLNNNRYSNNSTDINNNSNITRILVLLAPTTPPPNVHPPLAETTIILLTPMG